MPPEKDIDDILKKFTAFLCAVLLVPSEFPRFTTENQNIYLLKKYYSLCYIIVCLLKRVIQSMVRWKSSTS